MPRMKINGVEHDFPNGMNILEACKQSGHYVPHFCYHHALKVVGSCRMCKVEVVQGGRSRVDISCNLTVAEGLEVWTDTPAVKKQQQMTLEYLLANHPVDCPVCDDAGECDLQNFYLQFGRHESRLLEPKIHKEKAKDIGRSVVLDSERCVLCSRCVRFCQDVTKTHELGIFGMGSTERLDLRPGARLDNDYAGNVVDLCPVGALTDKDFRFKRRVWFLKSVNSICPGCSRGCNVRIDYDDNPYHGHKKTYQMKTHRTPPTAMQRIQRLKPRDNDAVNGSWMCDAGRYGYRPTDDGSRLGQPLTRQGSELKVIEWDTAVKALASGLFEAMKGGAGKIAVVASPMLTSEELYAVKAFFIDQLKLPNVDHNLPGDPEWYGDDLLRTPDPFPNRIGAEWIGIEPGVGGIGVSGLEDAVKAGKIDTLVTLLADPRTFLSTEAVAKLKRRYGILRNLSEGTEGAYDLVLPAASWGEYRGLFTNFRGRVQRAERAFEPFGQAKPVWKIVSDLSAHFKKPQHLDSHADALKALMNNVPYYREMSWDAVGDEGLTLQAVKVFMKAAG